MGLDFSVVYPTIGLITMEIDDEEVRRAACRALNRMKADTFSGLEKRMTAAAVIPMHTPQEAIDELEYVVKTLGLKVVMMASMVRRPIPAIAEKAPQAARLAMWFDMLGLDSEHDYDPLWAKCVELGISPTFHSGSRGVGLRISPSNFVYNHIGHFAAASEAVCKAIFLGGVTRRFPQLKMAFLEGGVGWACGLYADLIGHWKKRNREALEEVNPANLDRKMLAQKIREYGGKWFEQKLDDLDAILNSDQTPATGGLRELDDFAACKIKRAEDIRDLFVNNFYFGCEADDPTNAYAFNRKANPYGAKLNVLFGSDIGHFDVPDMKEVLPEAYELVEDGLINDDDFREFLFVNPVRFWGESNPNFFKGTRVEKQAASLLRG
jgi:predicted TIM-barrel fold metal-dependent hydrolase